MNLLAERLDDHQKNPRNAASMIEEEKDAVSSTGSYSVSLAQWITIDILENFGIGWRFLDLPRSLGGDGRLRLEIERGC